MIHLAIHSAVTRIM